MEGLALGVGHAVHEQPLAFPHAVLLVPDGDDGVAHSFIDRKRAGLARFGRQSSQRPPPSQRAPQASRPQASSSAAGRHASHARLLLLGLLLGRCVAVRARLLDLGDRLDDLGGAARRARRVGGDGRLLLAAAAAARATARLLLGLLRGLVAVRARLGRLVDSLEQRLVEGDDGHRRRLAGRLRGLAGSSAAGWAFGASPSISASFPSARTANRSRRNDFFVLKANRLPVSFSSSSRRSPFGPVRTAATSEWSSTRNALAFEPATCWRSFRSTSTARDSTETTTPVASHVGHLSVRISRGPSVTFWRVISTRPSGEISTT